MTYQPAIGLEIHVQLKTRSKMFCGCRHAFGEPPNTLVCPVCLGYPGAMPTMNREAVRLTVLTGLMIGSRIAALSTFDRKSYFYPDMPKNYQITQYDRPLCSGGGVDIAAEGGTRAVRVRRIHLEEDVAKNMHFAGGSGVDFNRAGVPLMEIVTEPDLASPEEAFAFLLALKQIIEYAGVSEANLEQGHVRCDVNCSLRPAERAELGTKVEIKNLNTFKGVLHALEYEIRRQTDILREGGTVVQETRRWDVDTGVTESMRSKEEAHDYRYFPEPDLLPVALDAAVVAEWARSLPESPRRRTDRFRTQYGLPAYDAGVLAADRAVADFFEETARHSPNAKAVSNWIMTEILRVLSESGRRIDELRVTPKALAALVALVDARAIHSTAAKEVFGVLCAEGGEPEAVVARRGLRQVVDPAAIEAFVDEVLRDHPDSAADYRGGKRAALQFLVGQVMKRSRGKANPEAAQRALRSRLDVAPPPGGGKPLPPPE